MVRTPPPPILPSLTASPSPPLTSASPPLRPSLCAAGKPPQRHFSGLIPVDDAETVFLHYWFVESAGNPSTDPLLIWLNGGPGCSSLEGFLYEQGPLHFTGNRSSSGLPSLTDNPYAWTNVASIIFLESPAGVGFSYAKNGSTTTTDEITSQNNYGFLKNCTHRSTPHTHPSYR